MWIERKKLFQREKQNLKEIKIHIRKSQLFSKKSEKIENFDKNSVTLVYLEFSFFNFRAI